MNRILGIAIFALVSIGCATNSSVKQQIDPLSERLAAVEARNSAMEAKLAELSRKADTQAGETARVALVEDTAEKAQQAAADAEAAAARAETAADKAAKAFELGQRKGSR